MASKDGKEDEVKECIHRTSSQIFEGSIVVGDFGVVQAFTSDRNLAMASSSLRRDWPWIMHRCLHPMSASLAWYGWLIITSMVNSSAVLLHTQGVKLKKVLGPTPKPGMREPV